MRNLHQYIIGKKIKNVYYSELNNPLRKHHFNGFDVFDYGINIEFENEFYFHFYWKEEEFFEVGKGKYICNTKTTPNEVNVFNVNDRWKNLLGINIQDFVITYVDDSELIPFQVKLIFENRKEVVILVNEALNLDETIPYPIQYDFSGEIYVFFDTKLLKEDSTE